MIKQKILSSNSWIKQKTEQQARHCYRLEQNRAVVVSDRKLIPKTMLQATRNREIKLILEAIQCDECVHAAVVEREITKSK